MTRKYDHHLIEKKWQKHWDEKKAYRVNIDASKPKYYVLDMFPYPSGEGLHVGHVSNYIVTDVVARTKRKCGFNVLRPMGWDSFGLPAEQYAIRTGTHPAITTARNVARYKKQMQSLGFCYDWEREIATSDASYYKWTQWIFGKLYEKGLAYEADMLVNFCPALGTVLANEEVENGIAKDGGYPVERRPLRQWVLKITAYADRLLSDLDELDWPESLKLLQRNWIGKSEGARISFEVLDRNKGPTGQSIDVFTTSPHTLFGCTFMVVAPEHPILKTAVSSAQARVVEDYQTQASYKNDLARTDLAKEKSGCFTGAYVKNPITNAPIPLWVADYVLMGYGTGAVMGVPGHDERDREFAELYHLPVITVIDEMSGRMIQSSSDSCCLDGVSVKEAFEAVIVWLEKTKTGQRQTTYKLRDWLFSRQRYWGEPFPILHFEDGTKRLLALEELPLCPPELTNYKPSGDGQSPLAKVPEWVNIIDPKTNKKARRETNTMPQWAGSCWYYLRFCDPHNEKEAWSLAVERYWLPVDLYVGGVEHAVLHLLYARFWHKVLYDIGLVHTKEPFKCLRNQGTVLARSYRKKDLSYVLGACVKEEGGKYYHTETGEELVSQIDKMSKSKLNGVAPDEIVEEFGADALRLYELFMGPLDKEKFWNSDAVSGCRRFLQRVFDLCQSEKICTEEDAEAQKLSHRLLNAVTKDLEALSFNTAIAKMMEFLNDFSSLSRYPRSALFILCHCLCPLAPHMAQECWQLLGMSSELIDEPFPTINTAFLHDATVTIVIQVNGKVRGKIEVAKDTDKDTLIGLAKSEPNVCRHMTGPIANAIYVPNKVLNLVI